MTTEQIREEPGNIIYYNIWYGNPYQDYITGKIIDSFKQNWIAYGLDFEKVADYVLVFDCAWEGLSSRELSALFNQLTTQYGVNPRNFRVIFSCIEDIAHLPYPAICIPDRLIYIAPMLDRIDNIHWDNLPMNYQLTCLMRRASEDRVLLAKFLLDNFDHAQLMMTLGTGGVVVPDPIITDKFSKILWPTKFPIEVIQETDNSRYNNTAFPDTTLFYQAPVNLIVETSSQTDSDVWHKIFITEKTYKTLLWYQFPIWYAVPGLVSEVRKFGFDLFDDVFENHYYDQIELPQVRRKEIVALLHRVMSNYDLIDLRKQYWPRFQKNVAIFKQMHVNRQVQHQTLITALADAEYI
jgi:hypothetical protein